MNVSVNTKRDVFCDFTQCTLVISQNTWVFSNIAQKKKKHLHKKASIIKIKWLCYVINQKKVRVNLNIYKTWNNQTVRFQK